MNCFSGDGSQCAAGVGKLFYGAFCKATIRVELVDHGIVSFIQCHIHQPDYQYRHESYIRIPIYLQYCLCIIHLFSSRVSDGSSDTFCKPDHTPAFLTNHLQ